MRVLNAVKFLPFPAVKSPSPTGKNRARKGFLPRSLSRKLSKAGFWRKAAAVAEATGNEEPEIGRWKLFRDFLEQKDPPSLDKVTPLSATSATTSSSGSNSISWDSNDFGSSVTSVDLSSSFSVNSVNSGGKKDSILPPPLAMEEREKVGERVGVTVDGNESGAATTTESTSKEEWQNEDKEQFSPVSVLDCPFHDDEDITSPLHYSPMRIGGMKQKYMHKNHRFKSLSQLEPLNLDQRLTLSELGTLQTKPIDRPSSRNSSVEDEEAGHSNEAEELLGAIKSKYPSMGFEVENLLSDFFIEKLEEVESQPNLSTRPKHEAVKLAEEWVTGSVEGVWLGWEVEKGREAYVREMEKGERWKNLEGENQEVGLELEFEVWSSLMEEILLDL